MSQAEARKPVRITFGTPEGGASCYWYLRERADGSFLLTSHETSDVVDHDCRTFTTPDDAVWMVKTRVEGSLMRLYKNYENLKATILAGDTGVDRPGFRPGYGLRQAKAGLQKFLSAFKRNEAVAQKLKQDVMANGWPPLVINLPWLS